MIYSPSRATPDKKNINHLEIVDMLIIGEIFHGFTSPLGEAAEDHDLAPYPGTEAEWSMERHGAW